MNERTENSAATKAPHRLITIIKIIMRCALFCVVFTMLFSYVSAFHIRDSAEADEMHAFYNEPRNSIDVLFVGSSPLLRGVSPMLMYEAYGFTGYVRATALQPSSASYGLLAEALETQSPKVVVLLFDNIYTAYDYAAREGDLRRTLDGMRNSLHKARIVAKITAADKKQSALSYFFPLLRYHTRWKEIVLGETKPVIRRSHSVNKGHIYLTTNKELTYPEQFMEPTGREAVFDAETQSYIEKSIKLCTDKGIPVVLLHLPKMYWTYEQSVALEALAKANGVAYLDLDRKENRDAVQLNPMLDFYDTGHVNLWGSSKASLFLGDYLSAQYALPDRRGDPAFVRWAEDLQMYKQGIEEALAETE